MHPLILLILSGCSLTSPRFPGPLSPVGASRPAPDEVPDYIVKRRHADELEYQSRGYRPDKLLAAAEYYLKRAPEDFADDCSGFVCAIYGRIGLPIRGSTKQLWSKAERAGATHQRKWPTVGDLAFFDNTYDRDKNGRWDDDLTHVGLVTRVDPNGTIVIAHGGTSAGRTTMVMNLLYPDETHDSAGQRINDYLRRPGKGDRDDPRRLASRLWRGFATMKKDDWNHWLSDAES